MDVALLAAKLFGAGFAAIGLGFLLNSKYYQKMFVDMMKDTTFIFMWGVFAFVVGILIVLSHNIWEANWGILVTLVGWIALVKGASLLIYPKFVCAFEGWFKNKAFFMFAGGFALVLGLVMLYFGFYS